MGLKFWKKREPETAEPAFMRVSTSGIQGPTLWSYSLGFTPEEPVEPPATVVAQAEPVVAWRKWKATPKHRVRGANGSIWRTTFYAAGCNRHESPSWGCRCGINACKEAHLFQGVDYPTPGDVYGRVELSGTVHEYERAYRASHALMVDLVVIEEAAGARQSMIDGLAARYGIPVSGSEAPDFINQIRVIAALEDTDGRGEAETDDQGAGEKAGHSSDTSQTPGEGAGEEVTGQLAGQKSSPSVMGSLHRKAIR